MAVGVCGEIEERLSLIYELDCVFYSVIIYNEFFNLGSRDYPFHIKNVDRLNLINFFHNKSYSDILWRFIN